MILAVFRGWAGLVVRQVNVVVKATKVSDGRVNQGGLGCQFSFGISGLGV